MTNLSANIQTIDPAQAKLWLERKYKAQRDIDWDHVKRLARAMTDGTFGLAYVTFSILNGEHHLINGQHTLQAIVMSKKPQTLAVSYVQVADEEEEAELYYRTDRGRPRKLSDSLRVTDLAQRLNLTDTQVNRTASALRFIKSGFKQTKSTNTSDDDLVEWLPLWAWECKQVYRIMVGARDRERNAITRVSIFSIALVTMRFQHAKALEFWEGVAKDDGLARYDPRKTLHDWLHELQGQNASIGKRVRNNEITRGAAITWNLFFSGEGKGLRYIRVPDANSKIVIAGTDYSGIQQDDYLPLYPGKHAEEE